MRERRAKNGFISLTLLSRHPAQTTHPARTMSAILAEVRMIASSLGAEYKKTAPNLKVSEGEEACVDRFPFSFKFKRMRAAGGG